MTSNDGIYWISYNQRLQIKSCNTPNDCIKARNIVTLWPPGPNTSSSTFYISNETVQLVFELCTPSLPMALLIVHRIKYGRTDRIIHDKWFTVLATSRQNMQFNISIGPVWLVLQWSVKLSPAYLRNGLSVLIAKVPVEWKSNFQNRNRPIRNSTQNLN